jgi:hypothetical protein
LHLSGPWGGYRPTISEIEAGRKSASGEEFYELSRLYDVAVA